MVRKRIITVLTVNNGVLYRTRNFIPDYRYTINFVDAWSVDEVVLLDITRFGEGKRKNFYILLELFSRNCFVPLTVGGGVRTIEDFRILFELGADKIVVNSEAVGRPDFIKEAAMQFGSQCVVLSIDAKENQEGNYHVYANWGTKCTGMNPAEWARQGQEHGAGEILIQSIDKDGTLEGYDNRLNKMITEIVTIPVVVCSGAGNWKNLLDGFIIGGASAVCISNIYHFTEASILSAKNYLNKAGINIRSG